MSILNPFNILPIESFKDFGGCFAIAVAVFSLLCYLIAWIGKITYRKLVELSMLLTPILFCWIAAVFYWYFAIIIALITWVAMTKIENMCMKIVIRDEMSGITATNSSKREKQAEQWLNMTKFEKQEYLDHYKSLSSSQYSDKKILLLSIISVPIMIMIFLMFGFHYYFF